MLTISTQDTSGTPLDQLGPSDDPVAIQMMLDFIYRGDCETGPAPYHLANHRAGTATTTTTTNIFMSTYTPEDADADT